MLPYPVTFIFVLLVYFYLNEMFRGIQDRLDRTTILRTWGNTVYPYLLITLQLIFRYLQKDITHFEVSSIN